MIEIAAANENAIVSSVGDVDNKDGCSGQLQRSDTLPTFDTLPLSETSADTNLASNRNNDGCQLAEEDSEFNDCSSSVSSQDSNVHSGIVGSPAFQISPKRSVFSQYWQKTGQTPVTLRPIRSHSTPNMFQSGLEAPSSQAQQAEITLTPRSSLSHRDSLDALFRSMSNADLLEDYDRSPTQEHSPQVPPQDLSFPKPPPLQPPPPTVATQGTPRRRRSILPPAPTQRSWRKSYSLPDVDFNNDSSNLDASKHKTRSLPKLRNNSSSSLPPKPLPSCLRPYSRYSSSKTTTTTTTTTTTEPYSPLSSSMSSLTTPSPGQLSRSDSCSCSTVSSSVSFLDAVDVRHFEPPKQTYAGKGWSEHFK